MYKCIYIYKYCLQNVTKLLTKAHSGLTPAALRKMSTNKVNIHLLYRVKRTLLTFFPYAAGWPNEFTLVNYSRLLKQYIKCFTKNILY